MFDGAACGHFSQHVMDPEALTPDVSVLFESEQMM